MSIFSRLQPVFIILAALLGIAAGKLSPLAARYSENLIEVFLMLLLFFVFLAVNIREITKSFSDLRFSVSALIINFVWTPLLTLLLSKIFMAGQVDLQIGFNMLMVTPCTDWYLIFTGLANGNVALGSSILPLNLVLQIVLLPVYLLLLMGRTVSFNAAIIANSIVFVLVVPLASANLIKYIFGKTGKKYILEGIAKKSDDIQFLLLCLAIVSMFASQGSLLFGQAKLFLDLLPPPAHIFCSQFFNGIFYGEKTGAPLPGHCSPDFYHIGQEFARIAGNSDHNVSLAACHFTGSGYGAID
jgi:ACR3 family arsenite efflux pump ArsB